MQKIIIILILFTGVLYGQSRTGSLHFENIVVYQTGDNLRSYYVFDDGNPFYQPTSVYRVFDYGGDRVYVYWNRLASERADVENYYERIFEIEEYNEQLDGTGQAVSGLYK